MSESILGKIASVRIGTGGYQDAMFGVSFTLEGRSSSVCDFWGCWGPDVSVGPHTKWTDAERISDLSDAFWRLAKLMKQAKVTDSAKLKGIPVEITFEGNTLKSWRVLEEVL